MQSSRWIWDINFKNNVASELRSFIIFFKIEQIRVLEYEWKSAVHEVLLFIKAQGMKTNQC